MNKPVKRLRPVLRFLIVVPTIFFVCCDAFIDRTTKVSGKVIDAETGLGIEYASVSVGGRDITSLLLPIIPSKSYGFTRTDANGNYEIVFEAEDKQTSYSIEVYAKEYTNSGSSIQVGKDNKLNIQLEPL